MWLNRQRATLRRSLPGVFALQAGFGEPSAEWFDALAESPREAHKAYHQYQHQKKVNSK